ncbi:hypothetical protein [Nostoc linckia]|uniref:hypothetical protein n=1 Tax=Nostoc linckia TaxID=92942 RepID=UPI00117FBE69|nr:hypothetical protein [Nostoc linckia]
MAIAPSQERSPLSIPPIAPRRQRTFAASHVSLEAWLGFQLHPRCGGSWVFSRLVRRESYGILSGLRNGRRRVYSESWAAHS